MSEEATKKARSSFERVVVWGGIVLLGGIVVFEGLQKFSYQSTLQAIGREFQEQDKTGKYHTLSEVEKLISGMTSATTMPHPNTSLKSRMVKWTSLAKDYQIQLVIENGSEDPPVIGFSTPLGTDPEVLSPVEPAAGS